ncbi:sulfate adenylyltransferase subunit 1 [Brackiella oedipodis]|uniref:sulfate adenylyltransferase subunit 1 n=1 Tax=Brackiella oedipodis TaxID=124225 RepID=UPI00048E43E7|nr:GTP-binding protein [Brackiella oedipodis]
MTHNSVLRVITAGSVDDGKSTLIGRLLFDSQGLMADQLQSLYEGKYRRTAQGVPDFAQLTDGLAAEREQGITIDVAYRYFATPKRKFILADTPGHEQYTRNMVTGASTADAAIILIDATRLDFSQTPLQLLPQTKRHSALVHLLDTPHILVAVNKLDLLDYSEDKFKQIVDAYAKLAQHLGIKDVTYVPISALKGDNIVNPSDNMPWYHGEPLLPLLENLPDNSEAHHLQSKAAVLPVQYVSRLEGSSTEHFRGYQGLLAQGTLQVGDAVRIEPNGATTTISAIYGPQGEQSSAQSGEVITVSLSDEIDISRGDTILAQNSDLQKHKSIQAQLCWMDDQALNPARKYLLKHAHNTVFAKIKSIDYVWDIKELAQRQEVTSLQLNDIGQVNISLQKPIVASLYADNNSLGAFILIDEATNNTVAAGLITALN